MSTVRSLLRSKGSEVYTVTPETTVADAVKDLTDHNIGALVVMEEKKLAGIISERDCVRRVMLRNKDARRILVSEVMTPVVIFARPEMSLQSCMAIMTDNHVRHLPVVENGNLIGIISLGDVVKLIISGQADTIYRLEELITEIEQDMP